MNAEVELRLAARELSLVLVALGQLPYAQVHELIGRIQAQAGPQLLATGAKLREESRELARDDA